MPAQPFGAAVVRDHAFVTLGGFTASPELGVVTLGKKPRLVRTIPLGAAGAGAAGVARAADGRALLIVAGTGLLEIPLNRLSHQRDRSFDRSLNSGLSSAIEVQPTADGRYAFVSLEYAGRIAVFDLRRSRLVGFVRVPRVNVGLALSPDGRRLYATAAAGAFPVTPASRGVLTVIDVRRAETRPSTAVLSSVSAGCDPVRVAVAPDGRSVWVTARGSNAVLEFGAGDLVDSPGRALRAVVPVGAEPVGIVLVKDGRRAVVLDSNRFDLPGATASVAVIDTERGKLLGLIPTGNFPREAVVAGEHLLVTEFDGYQLQTLPIERLP